MIRNASFAAIRGTAPIGIFGIVLIASMILWLPEYYLNIAVKTLFYVGVALAWNLVGGIAGQFSLGHSLFIGLGALLPAAMLLKSGINIWVGMGLAALVSALLGVALSWIAFRFRLGHLFFALITLAFGELGLLLVLGTEYLGAASGLFLPTGGSAFESVRLNFTGQSFLTLLAGALLAFGVCAWVVRSKLGYYLGAIRNNEDAAQAIGIDLFKYKTIAMVLSAILSSILGTLYARYSGFVDPNVYASPLIIVEIILFTVIGGLGTLWGPVLGAVLMVPLGEVLRGSFGDTLPGLHFVIYGLLIIVVIRLLPDGLIKSLRCDPARRAQISAPRRAAAKADI